MPGATIRAMRTMRSLVFWALIAAIGVAAWTVSVRPGRSPSASPRFPDGELVDLSHSYDEQTIFWPTAEPFRLKKEADGVTAAG